MKKSVFAGMAVSAALLLSDAAFAQAGPPPYGANITQEQARAAGQAAIAEARKNGWRMAVTIVDTAGNLVYFERVDDTQYASYAISQKKARSAALYKRATKVFQENLAKGATFYLTFPDVAASEGGVPVMLGGKIIGAIGASGGTGQQDGVVAGAGAAVVK